MPAPDATPPTPAPGAARPARFAWAPAVRRVEVRTVVDVTRDPPAAGSAAEQVRTTAYLTDTLSAGTTSGASGVRPVVVEGAGTAELRYVLDPARGALAAGAGEGRASLTVTVAGAAQRFDQRTRTEVVARP